MAEIKNPRVRRLIIVVLVLLGIIPIALILWAKYQMNLAIEDMDSAAQQGAKSYEQLRSKAQSGSVMNTYRLGNKIDLGDREITVFKFVPYSESGMKRNYGISNGQAMDVLIENTSSVPFKLSPLHFTVQDRDGRVLEFYDVYPGGKRPALSPYGDIAPGQKLRAFVTFVGENKPVVVYYKSPQGQMAKIVVD
jgi:hypothetical protein